MQYSFADEVSLVCLGPLTNIALAIKLYPEILCVIKDFFVMGGNATGNRIFIVSQLKN